MIYFNLLTPYVHLLSIYCVFAATYLMKQGYLLIVGFFWCLQQLNTIFVLSKGLCLKLTDSCKVHKTIFLPTIHKGQFHSWHALENRSEEPLLFIKFCCLWVELGFCWLYLILSKYY